uniref:Uncharacterized protein n=1 Tax=Siphoviridae sp. ctnOB2 TaxID=2825661 RepID=A0A8S5PDV3_9CAUD|nr:MAG TPA: hypothetical protein [Siphoviridae sp. ctnOB2]
MWYFIIHWCFSTSKNLPNRENKSILKRISFVWVESNLNLVFLILSTSRIIGGSQP